ncbi:amidohydrolase family protein [Robertkochia solimangrovi]|uniref:amidohydrolase family protein n=1 Tax=Robertkochia solimangrovi TaxID=2213046 RepID=UPI0011815099|nr:amidohydrolase family protein [Robertkochia solimangrovi]TRZ41631.1 hypothetical protein DMZ48_16615 [Robertkochia solimangrovi]
MKKKYLKLLPFLVSLIFLYACKQPVLKGDLIITHVNVVSIQDGEIIPNQNIVITGDKISQISSSDNFHLEADSVTDGSGLYIIPGLWDMHVHVRQYENSFFPRFIAYGVTGIRDMFNPVIDSIGKWKDSVNQANGLAPRIGLVAGRVVDGPQERNWPGSIVIQEGDDIREKVIEVANNKGYDFIKVYSGLSEQQLEEIAAEAKKAGIPIAGHLPPPVPIEKAIALGQQSIEHLEGFNISMTPDTDELYADIHHIRDSLGVRASFNTFWDMDAAAIDNRDPAKVKILMNLLKEKKVFPCTASFVMSDQQLNSPYNKVDLGELGLQHYPDSLINLYTARLQRTYPEELMESFKKANRGRQQLILDFEKYEVPFLAGTDASPTRPVVPGLSLHKELQLMQAGGAKPITILRSATWYPALFMNAIDTYGSVEEGKMADLLLLNGNPLEDIHNAENIHTVILKGKGYPKKELTRFAATNMGSEPE